MMIIHIYYLSLYFKTGFTGDEAETQRSEVVCLH